MPCAASSPRRGVELLRGTERGVESVGVDDVVAVRAARCGGEDRREVERLDSQPVQIRDQRTGTRRIRGR